MHLPSWPAESSPVGYTSEVHPGWTGVQVSNRAAGGARVQGGVFIKSVGPMLPRGCLSTGPPAFQRSVCETGVGSRERDLTAV